MELVKVKLTGTKWDELEEFGTGSIVEARLVDDGEGADIDGWYIFFSSSSSQSSYEDWGGDLVEEEPEEPEEPEQTLAEHDAQLGRWRTPNFPDYVIKPLKGSDEPREVVALHEENFSIWYIAEDDVAEGSSDVYGAAYEYFQEHPKPVPLPNPWVGAVRGEIWELTLPGDRQVRALALGAVEGFYYIHGEGTGYLPYEHQDILDGKLLLA